MSLGALLPVHALVLTTVPSIVFPFEVPQKIARAIITGRSARATLTQIVKVLSKYLD